jgi:WD40 repeat protein
MTVASMLVQVIRQYHGHLSGIYALALHPTLDVLISGGRDSVARVWDMRTKVQVGLCCTPRTAELHHLCPSTTERRRQLVRHLGGGTS